jgi:5-(carboxyamino)imidazole ribonucleotide mutase
MNPESHPPLVGVLMGSPTDAAVMQKATDVLTELGVPFELKVCSAHRTPQRVIDYAASAEARGIRVIIAAAGMSAHLPGMLAALTHLPVLGVPMEGKLLGGLDALLSMCNMPRGTPVATMGMGLHGAVNAALFAAAMLSLHDDRLRYRLLAYRQAQTAAVQENLPHA